MEKIGSDVFDDKLKSAEHVIIDFSSPGCAPCKKVPPLLEEILAESGGLNIAAYEVDIVDDMQIAQKYFVLGVPTIIVFKNGKEVQRFNSVPKKEKILKAIK
ncbi:MAG: thioredoxin family protein [Candidatus Aminicenantes bacterium]|nr:thioredoxin family protein [Candidatus Aminicenantes bacterium]